MKSVLNLFMLVLFCFLFLVPDIGMAQVELFRDRTTGELDSLEQKLRDYKKTGKQDTTIVDIYIELGISLYRKDAPQSKKYINEALSLSRKIDYPYGIAKSKQILGYLNILNGNLNKALEQTRSSLSTMDTLNMPIEVNNLRSNLAYTYLEKGQYDQAIRKYLNALPQMYAHQDTFNINRAHFNMAIIYNDLEQDSLAIHYYNRAIDIIKKFSNSPVSLSLAYHDLSGIYLENGDLAKAQDFIEKAIDLRSQTNDEIGMIKSLIIQGRIYIQRSEYDKALETLRLSLEQMNAATSNDTRARAYHALATLHYHIDETGNALNYGKKAYEYAIDSELVLKISKLLASLYEEQQNFKEANFYRKKHIALQDSVYASEQDQRLSIFTSQFEIEDRQNQIELLEKENELREAQLERESFIRSALVGGSVLMLIIILLIAYGYREKRKTAKKLETKNKQLEKLNEDKDMFLRMAAHDLKTPLSAITGLAELIKMENSEGEKNEISKFAKDILMVSDRMLEIIKNFLNVEAIESGDEIIRPKTIDLQSLLNEITDQYRMRAKEKEIDLHCETAEDNFEIFTDESAMKGILENLVSNAIKYSPQNKNVWIKAYQENNAARIEIEDEGPGFTEEDRQDMFKKFKTLSADPTGGEHSNGLGLYIVKNMVERLDGSIECKTEQGKGTTFVINLPKDISAN